MTPSERLVRRTAVGLAAVTMILTVALLAGVGLATAAVAIRTTDASVDRSLRDAATAAIAYLELVDVDAPPTPAPPGPTATMSPVPTPSATDENDPTDDLHPPQSAGPTQDVQTDDGGGESSEPGGRVGSPFAVAVAAVVAAATPPPSVRPLDLEPGDQPPASSDTFFLVLDANGQLLSNPRRVLLTGLPDAAAAVAAVASGEDWRTVTADGAQVRLFTQRVTDGRGGPPALLQSGMVLTLHSQQRDELLLTILLASLLGLGGAALVTALVTRRALAPIRSAFAAERRFVAAASHEIRTPVALLHALAEVLQREDLVKPDGRPMVDDLIDETDRLGRLVGDLLALSSAEAGAIDIEPTRIDGRAFASDLCRRVRPMAERRGLSLDLEQREAASAPALPLLTDGSRLAQLLLILVDNAFDHSPPGGRVTITVDSASDRRTGARVSFSISDQGPGVPVADRERIFEPFATLRGRRRSGESTGLGLAIATTLADRLGASIDVGEAPGGGAVFSVSLPLAPNATNGHPGAPEMGMPPDASTAAPPIRSLR